MAKRIIAVFGATGAQGGGLARAILGDKASEFAVRAITRKPESDNAKVLASQGAARCHARSPLRARGASAVLRLRIAGGTSQNQL